MKTKPFHIPPGAMMTTTPHDLAYSELSPRERAAIDQYRSETGQDRPGPIRYSWPALRRLYERVDLPASPDAACFLASEAIDLLKVLHDEELAS